MAHQDAPTHIPNPQLITADYIANQLPSYDPMFQDPPLHFDPASGRYVPNRQAMAAALTARRGADDHSLVVAAPTTASDDDGLPPRPAWAEIKDMAFWNSIFVAAMATFCETTKPVSGRSNTVYDIRTKNDWVTVYDALVAARDKYGEEGGRVGWLRKVRRKVADNIGPAVHASKVASKIAPNDLIATPVLGAVEVMLDVVKKAAQVRIDVLESVGGLLPIFSDVEVFLSTWQHDDNIFRASLNLAVTTLATIERAIGFFLKHELLKAGNALFSGEDYQATLVESLKTMRTKSRCIIEEALKTHMHETHIANTYWANLSQQDSRETLKIQAYMLQKLENVSNGVNSIKDLLTEHLTGKERELSRKTRQLEDANRKINELTVEVTVLRGPSRGLSPAPQGGWYLPPPSSAPAPQSSISAEGLRMMLNSSDVDVTDAAFVTNKKALLPAAELAQAEQVLQSHLFGQWIVSAGSSKLLATWDRPRTVAGVSALSVFCATLAGVLRARNNDDKAANSTMMMTTTTRPRFVSALWFCGRHADRHAGRAMAAGIADQLLRQHAFDTRSLFADLPPARLDGADADALGTLLDWLVRRLPPTVTFVCMVDGVALCERRELEGEAPPVLARLLALVDDPAVEATVKVLFTSAPSPSIIKAPFKREGAMENLMIDVEQLPRTASVASNERMARVLERGLGSRDALG
ncbi:hypothetical protein N658DRAFT_418442 [Parathielavia hyrcaniae]|uniref:Uncharacterized protein n=1 Tax=Parathielavia hyrcaniae TaxID=113614 RepID=A0AAN6T4H9_9PEZI|nr:hypothetical protein N658DRAFT_418442 [Parathielavia hyrcaniae]